MPKPINLACLACCALTLYVLVYLNIDSRISDLKTCDYSSAVSGSSLQRFEKTPNEDMSYTENSSSMYGKPIFGRKLKIIYNAVPKCGSRVIENCFQRLGRNSYHLEHEVYSNETSLSSAFNKARLPALYRDHVPFPSIGNHDGSVVYINMIRDPVQQAVSLFYFRFFGDGETGATASKENMVLLKKSNITTIDDCYTLRDSEICRRLLPRMNSTLNYIRRFCGIDTRCSTDPDWALNRAIENIDKYTFIGHSDDYENSMKILSMLFPDTMAGLHQVYNNVYIKLRKLYKSKNKASPSLETVNYLRDHLYYEYKIYNHIRDRYRKLKKRLYIT